MVGLAVFVIARSGRHGVGLARHAKARLGRRGSNGAACLIYVCLGPAGGAVLGIPVWAGQARQFGRGMGRFGLAGKARDDSSGLASLGGARQSSAGSDWLEPGPTWQHKASRRGGAWQAGLGRRARLGKVGLGSPGILGMTVTAWFHLASLGRHGPTRRVPTRQG
jgi:hypothetical protein